MRRITTQIERKFFVQMERELMRDKRLKPASKLLYVLFVSMSETMENVYPSYGWIANEIGYEYSGEFKKGEQGYERAMMKYVHSILQPLLDLGLIKQTGNVGRESDYEVCEYVSDPVLKSTPPLNKKVQGDPVLKSTPSNKEYSSNKEVVSTATTKKPLLELVEEHFPELVGSPYVVPFLRHIENVLDCEQYLVWLKENKRDKITSYKLYRYFYEDYHISKEEKAYQENMVNIEEMKYEQRKKEGLDWYAQLKADMKAKYPDYAEI